MRLSSFLPMLLLLLGLTNPLKAQQNCEIFDLSATAVQVNPATCEFFVLLNFQHIGTTNQFQVKGNGHNYGVFQYGQLPVVIGPLTASTSSATTFEFVVQDMVLQDCQAFTTLTVPACSSLSGCEIFDLTVETGDCNPNALTYSVTINFQVSNPGNDFFDVFTANGVLIGTFPLSALPLTIPSFPWGGGAFDVLKVCINDQPNCCVAKEFHPPLCVGLGCGIVDLNVQTGDCVSDSTYKALINFGLLSNTGITDSFQLFLDGVLQGTFGLNQRPLPVIFEHTGANVAVVKVCANLVPGVICCKEKEFQQPHCVPACKISDLKVETDTCTTDSTFGIWVNFHVADPNLVDSFDLWGNTHFIGTFGINQLPLHVSDFQWNGLIFNTIKVCTGNDQGCCKELQFLAPNCLPFGPCEITNIFTLAGACTSDSTYKLLLNFNATNPGDGSFLLLNLLTGQADTFQLTDLPLTFTDFPWHGEDSAEISICILGNNVPPTFCCRPKKFDAPSCLVNCEIGNLHATPGDCDPATHTFPLKINFEYSHPGNDFFDVYANGQLLGTYPLNQLPLTIPNYQASGNAVDVIQVCINDHPNCCATTEFETPNCDSLPCHVYDLMVEVGDCSSDSTYHVSVKFQYSNPGNDFFDLYANGQLFGTYPLSSLPLQIPNFPASGNAFDHIKVCINDQPDCCIGKEFQAPNCGGGNNCHVYDLMVEVGDCNQDGTYHVSVKFQYSDPGNDFFDLYANGQLFGTYLLSQLPLQIPNFPASGNAFDHIKVCINDHPDCCIGKEFQAPNCGSCEITNLHVETGDCNADSTYHLTVNFQVVNSTATHFVLFGNGALIGTYALSQLPLHIPNFPWDGAGPNDFIKVCVGDNSSALTCCKTLEFPIPSCLHGQPCDINDLHVQTGDCTSDSSYVLTFNFNVSNPPANTFGVWANGQFLGMYGLGQLPITIQQFPWNGGNNDVLKVCFSSTTPGAPECCDIIEFPVPSCLFHNGDCSIFDLVADPGGCTSDSTYVLGVNFHYNIPPSDSFALWANGQLYGVFHTNQLPLLINNFPWNGGNNDVVKVCFVTDDGVTSCCKAIEFAVPDCLGGGNCEIFGMVVDPGDCSSDSTYSLFLNFQVANPPGGVFGVWANNTFLGTFNLTQLPLNFPNFPWGGGAHDAVKVCFVNSGAAVCCRTLEFDAPDCLGGNNECHIYDAFAVRTACLCGQFFVALTFQHENGGAGGFDVVGNGNNYGTFPYSTPQPIILGPFMGDGTTNYEFGVVDHLHSDCHDGFQLGVVECATPITEPGRPASLVLAPNPASNWLNVTAMLENGLDIGQATVKIYHADGRLIQSLIIGNASNFQMDISNLPSGVYRLSVLSGAGSLDGSFSKQ